MALTPPNDEAFFREVDDNLRQERMIGLARKWGKVAAIAVVLALAALAAFLWWRAHRADQAGVDGETFAGALDDVEQGRAAAGKAAFSSLAASPRDGYSGGARLALAAASAKAGDITGAAATYAAIAGDAKLPQPVRDLALIRGTAATFDMLPPQAVVDRLKRLTVTGNPWFGSAGELTGVAYLKMNRPDRAGPLFVSIAADGQVPVSLRSRAAGIATALGQSVAPIALAAAKD